MSNASNHVAAAHAALAEATKRIPVPAKWDYGNPSQIADLERGHLAQSRAITHAILAVVSELHTYNISAAFVTGLIRPDTPTGGMARDELLEHIGITTTAKES